MNNTQAYEIGNKTIYLSFETHSPVITTGLILTFLNTVILIQSHRCWSHTTEKFSSEGTSDLKNINEV